MRSHHGGGSPLAALFVMGSFFIFFTLLISLAYFWNYHNRKKLKKFMEKNGLNYKPSDPQIISQFTPYYKIDLKTYDANSLKDIVTGSKNNIKITMFSTEDKSEKGNVYRNKSRNTSFKDLIKVQNEEFNKFNNSFKNDKIESLKMPDLLPLKLNAGSTILKLEGDLNLPKFRLVSIWTPPAVMKKFLKILEPELPGYAIKFTGDFGKYFYVDYYEDETIIQIFNENLLNDFVKKSLKAKGPVIGFPWQFISLGNVVIVDFSMPTNADMKINLLEIAIRLTLMFKNEAKQLA